MIVLLTLERMLRVGKACRAQKYPILGTFSGTLSGKWAKVGKMGGNEGNSDCSVENWEILGLKRPKIKVSVGNKAVVWGGGGGAALATAPEEKSGKMGENGVWGEIFCD